MSTSVPLIPNAYDYPWQKGAKLSQVDFSVMEPRYCERIILGSSFPAPAPAAFSNAVQPMRPETTVREDDDQLEAGQQRQA